MVIVKGVKDVGGVIYVCNECRGKEPKDKRGNPNLSHDEIGSEKPLSCRGKEPCRKTYEEWSVCEESIRTPKKMALRQVVEAELPLPRRITNKTKKLNAKWHRNRRLF